MSTRRDFLKKVLRGIGLLGLSGASILYWHHFSFGGSKKVLLPKGTDFKTLIQKNPADLDTRSLDLMPLERFETMGMTDHQADLKTWTLKMDGLVEKPIGLSHSEVLGLPPLQRNVLLICPGIFVNHGRWKGFSVKALIDKAGYADNATHVTFRGPSGPDENLQRFPMAEILSDKVFLAYQVNGKPLPQKHGFPLRVVAEGYYGFDWIKYVDRLTVEEIPASETGPPDAALEPVKE